MRLDDGSRAEVLEMSDGFLKLEPGAGPRLSAAGGRGARANECAGVLVLRVKEPGRARPFKVPYVWVVAPAGILACSYIMLGLPPQAWERFGWWLAIGIVLFLAALYYINIDLAVGTIRRLGPALALRRRGRLRARELYPRAAKLENLADHGNSFTDEHAS